MDSPGNGGLSPKKVSGTHFIFTFRVNTFDFLFRKQIGHSFGYQRIYITASLSVAVSIMIYILFLVQEGGQRAAGK
ncbi:hypothetical protein CUU66_12900 [Peribacillus deserti]|uniref:Uncharacterized protein n=1 Tax=Peribacillus deserti TaxID=673318 RepID=A0A2N5M538_9BACI|nr:hypothetical protein CUU66_12900 [Peribacillus deserti]